MAHIIAGMVETMTEAERTREALLAAGFPAEHVVSFFNNAPGQHGETPIGGDETADPKAEGVHKGTAAGAAIGGAIGLAAGLTAGPAAPAVAAVGAYVGSLAGTARATEDEDARTSRRPAGVIVAVNVGSTDREDEAIRVLREAGADNIERAEGLWENGDWADFDPVHAPNLVDQRNLHAPGVDR